ncbi:MAG: hypothetical protein IJO19_04450 [Clostridia bacterium]|nr:hypothetical protein [Clostridia bacterium]
MKTDKENFILRINFNGKRISLKENQAKHFVKLGINSEKNENAYGILEFLAKREGKTLEEFAKDLKEQSDKTLKNKYLEKVGEDEELANMLFETENQKVNLPVKSKDDFETVKEKFPQFKTPEDLPSEVVILSETNNITLFDAYLRYIFSQQEKIKQQKQAENQNKQNSAGSLKDNQTDYGFAIFNAMIKGINR